MPRLPFLNSSENFYHVTNRCINREWFNMSMSSVWRIMEDELYFTVHSFHIEVLSFVLMSNHYHMLVRSPKANLSEAMRWFNSRTSLQIAKPMNRLNHIWAHRFHRSEIRSNYYLLSAYKYVYRNPVEEGVCARVEDYPFSTLYGILGKGKIMIPVCEDTFFFDSSPLSNYFRWLNHKPDRADTESVRRALKKKVYQYAKKNNRRHHLEFNTL